MIIRQTLFISVFFLFLSVLAIPAFSEDKGYPSDDYEKLRRVQDLLHQKRYADVLSFLEDFKEDNPVPDLVLLYRASAERGLGRFEESNNLIKRLKNNYPDSILLKRALAIEARNSISIIEKGGDGLKTAESESILSGYVSSYPDDHEVIFFFAGYLKSKGDIKRAREFFLMVYKGNSRFSERARKELDASDITAYVLTEKASRYIEEREYRKAEEILKKAISLRDETIPKDEILRRLGYSLFMQKKYGQAAEEYMRAGDIYNAARSLFRKGDMEGFNRMLSRLKEMKDKRAGSLFLALASKKRREGSLEEAIKLFEEVKRNYPLLEEEALWGIAWAYYRNGDCDKARETLKRLNEKYPSRRYSYWLKKCSDGDSGSSGVSRKVNFSDLLNYTKLDFYTIVEYMNSLKEFEDLVIDEAGRKALDPSIYLRPIDRPAELLRFYILLSLGYRDEAITELIRNIKKSGKPDVLISAGHILLRNGAYRNAMSLTSLINREFTAVKKEMKRKEFRELLYPLAFWATVEWASKRFDIDPFLLLSVMREESRFEPEARSVAGALGLMQLMPATARRLTGRASLDIKDDNDLKDAKTNITIGAFYLKELLKEFGSPVAAVAAYNAGEERVKEWLERGKYGSVDEFVEDIPFKETKNYVKRVLTTYVNYYLLYR